MSRFVNLRYPPQNDFRPGNALRDRYVLERELGRGGMATSISRAISGIGTTSP